MTLTTYTTHTHVSDTNIIIYNYNYTLNPVESNYRDGTMSHKNVDVGMSKPKKKVRMTGWMWFYNIASFSFFLTKCRWKVATHT